MGKCEPSPNSVFAGFRCRTERAKDWKQVRSLWNREYIVERREERQVYGRVICTLTTGRMARKNKRRRVLWRQVDGSEWNGGVRYGQGMWTNCEEHADRITGWELQGGDLRMRTGSEKTKGYSSWLWASRQVMEIWTSTAALERFAHSSTKSDVLRDRARVLQRDGQYGNQMINLNDTAFIRTW